MDEGDLFSYISRHGACDDDLARVFVRRIASLPAAPAVLSLSASSSCRLPASARRCSNVTRAVFGMAPLEQGV